MKVQLYKKLLLDGTCIPIEKGDLDVHLEAVSAHNPQSQGGGDGRCLCLYLCVCVCWVVVVHVCVGGVLSLLLSLLLLCF